MTVGGRELSDICEKSLLKNFTYVNNKSYLFKGTVRENLLMANPDCSDEVLLAGARKGQPRSLLKGENGLDTALSEKGSNFRAVNVSGLPWRAPFYTTARFIF